MMEYKEIGPGLRVYQNVIDNFDEQYKEIRSLFESENFQWGEPMIISDGYNIVDYHVRKLKTSGIPYELSKNPPETGKDKWEDLQIKLGSVMYKYFTPVEEHYKGDFGVETRSHDLWSILNYGEGEYFRNHLDDCLEFPRTVSVIYYLNDDYDGGEIIFPRFGVIYKPKANDLLVFPSSYVYNHSVNNVYNGHRYAVVSWLD